MSALREGSSASYVGYEADGIEVGDRCLVLSAEKTQSFVRWTTGSKIGQYENVHNEDLVADQAPNRYEDEFTFESYSNRIVNTACLEVINKKGERGLFAALSSEGHMDSLRIQTQSAISAVIDVLSEDPVWLDIQSNLGVEEARSFMFFAVKKSVEELSNLMIEAQENGDE